MQVARAVGTLGSSLVERFDHKHHLDLQRKCLSFFHEAKDTTIITTYGETKDCKIRKIELYISRPGISDVTQQNFIVK